MSESFDERNALWLRIVTPERIRLEVNVQWVQIPTEQGLLGIWPQHAPLVSAVVPGDVEYESHDGTHREWVAGGILHIRHGQVLVLTGSREQVYTTKQSGIDAWDESTQELAEIGQELGLDELGPEESA